MISSYLERAKFPACDREVRVEMEIRTSDKHVSITLMAIACSTMFEII